MDRMRIVEDTSTKLVLERSFTTRDIWRGWGKSLVMPLLIIVGSTFFVIKTRLWVLGIIPALAFIGLAFPLLIMLTSERKITVTIDLHSNVASRVEKLLYGKVTKYELALDQANRILIHSVEQQHSPRVTMWLVAGNHPPLEIVNNYDLKSLVRGSYIDLPQEDASEIVSLDILGVKIGEFLRKPVTSKLTDYQGNTISEEIKP